MPIFITASINGQRLGVLTIGRLEELEDSRDEYTYEVILSDSVGELRDGVVQFQHNRHDSVWILIQKALFALGEKGDLPLDWE